MTKRRTLGTGGLSLIEPGKWKVTVPLGKDPLTGKYRQKSRTVYGDRSDAEAVAAALKAGPVPCPACGTAPGDRRPWS